MKLSVSLSESDIEVLDKYIEQTGMRSRSAAVQKAISLLRGAELADEYAEAFAEWERSEERALWESAAGDGLSRATW